MVDESSPQKKRTEILRSSYLYLGEFEASEAITKNTSQVNYGTRLKTFSMPVLYWLVKHTPLIIAMLPMRILILILRVMYLWKSNPIRTACEHICVLAGRKGMAHEPRRIYQQFLTNAEGIVYNYFSLYRNGINSVLDKIRISQLDGENMNSLVQKHGGVILAVPHNFGSAFSALKMNKTFPLFVITRNSSTIDRTKTALDFFERMEVTILMVRGGNPFELSRALFSVLKRNKVVAATVDSIDPSRHGVKAEMFGQQVAFAAWASKIGTRKKVPIVPCYFRSNGKHITAFFGEPLTTEDLHVAVQHYVSFFEEYILRYPDSWAFMGDTRWRDVLKKAAQNI